MEENPIDIINEGIEELNKNYADFIANATSRDDEILQVIRESNTTLSPQLFELLSSENLINHKMQTDLNILTSKLITYSIIEHKKSQEKLAERIDWLNWIIGISTIIIAFTTILDFFYK